MERSKKRWGKAGDSKEGREENRDGGTERVRSAGTGNVVSEDGAQSGERSGTP
jgi:hypothetical protein